MILNAGLGLKT